MSNYAPYRWCVVSECENTSVKTPDKLWIQVPVDINMRNTWLKAAYAYFFTPLFISQQPNSVHVHCESPKCVWACLC